MTTQNIKTKWLLGTGVGRLRELRPYWVKMFAELACGKCKDFRLLKVLLCEKSISKENPLLLIEKVPSLVLPRKAIMSENFVQFALYYLSNCSL